jgi:hypothetical protein
MSKILATLSALFLLMLVASPVPADAAQRNVNGVRNLDQYEFSSHRRYYRRHYRYHRRAYWRRPYGYYGYGYGPYWGPRYGYYRPYWGPRYYAAAPFPFFPFFGIGLGWGW